MLKLTLVAEARAVLVAESVYPLPAVATVGLLKVATPFWGVTINVPPKAAGFPERPSLIGFVADEIMLPLVSSIATVTAGEIAARADAFVGCWRNASLARETGVVVVRLDDATVLCDTPSTAIAWTVEVTPIDKAPEYKGEEVVGTVPSVV
jgi:hypothetical protein